jgi:hypothetical protein
MNSRKVVHGLLLGGAILAGALALKWAQHSHLVSGDFAVRGVEVIIGLGLAIYANFIPKNARALKLSAARAARVQSAMRFGGWVFTLAGLGFAAIWAFAPMSIAASASMAVMGGGVAVTLANLGLCLASPKDATPA